MKTWLQPGLTPERRTEVEALVVSSYRTMANEKGIDIAAVPRLRECRDMSTLLMLEAPSMTEVEGIRPHSRTDGIVDEHRYASFPGINGEDIVVDPMWQQFVPEEKLSADLPPALIGTREDVQATALAAGVNPDTVAALWGPETAQNTQLPLTVQQRVAQAAEANA